MRTDTSSDIKDLLEENLRLSREILASAEKARKQARWTKIFSVVRLVIILIPIVIALLYIPPFLAKFSDSFGKIYGGEQFNILELLKGQSGGKNINFDELKAFLDKQMK